MIAVGIDVSKSKSTVAVIDSNGVVLASPYTIAHTQPELHALAKYLKELKEPVTILMEYTGHYHYPVLKQLQSEGFPVCLINPYQMKKYGLCESLLMLWRNPINLFRTVPWSRNTRI